MKDERFEVYEFKKESYMNDIKPQGSYKGFKVFTFRDPDGDLAGICPVLDVFNIDDGTLNDDEDLVIEDLKGAIDSTIKTVREYNNGKIWSFGLDKTITV